MEARLLSKDLMQYLEGLTKTEAKIHSVFKDALNIITPEGDLITLLVADKDIEPMSALVTFQPREIKGFRQEDPVELSNEGILFKNNNKWLATAKKKLWEPEIVIKGDLNSIESQRKKLEEIKEVLMNIEDSLGLSPLVHYIAFNDKVQLLNKDSPPLNEYCDFIQIRLYQLLKAINEKMYEEALTLIPNFVGFGPGLTPSSDDILAGILVTIVYDEALKSPEEKDTKALEFSKRVYETSLGRTTSVSEQMLKFASQGMVSEGYRNLLRGLFFQDTIPFKTRMEGVLKHGASSGSDFLFGVYCMNSIRLNRYLKEGEK